MFCFAVQIYALCLYYASILRIFSQIVELFYIAMEKREQLKLLIEYYTNGNKSQFSKMLGISAQGLSSWISRNTYDSEKLFANCRGLSAKWLLSGEGEMIINTDNQPNEEAPPTDSIGGDVIKQALNQMRILVENNGKLVETNRQLVEANREQFDRMMQLLERHSRNKCDGRDCLAVSS